MGRFVSTRGGRSPDWMPNGRDFKLFEINYYFVSDSIVFFNPPKDMDRSIPTSVESRWGRDACVWGSRGRDGWVGDYYFVSDSIVFFNSPNGTVEEGVGEGFRIL